MKRRDLLHNGLLGLLAASAGPGLFLPRRARAQAEAPIRACAPTDLPRTVVNVMLQGGADFRFLFMPAPSHPDPLLLDRLWAARRGLYDAAYPDYETMFEAEYLPVTDPRDGPAFGIARSAAWLHGEFAAGNVAVVANAVCSRNRRHDQSILNADAGVPDLEVLNFDRDGWGGRLVEAIGADANAVELGSSVSVFSKGSEAGARLRQVVHAEDLRDMALAGVDPDTSPGSRRNVLARALNAWYEGRSEALLAERPADWVYRPFLEHRAALEAFGQAVNERLEACGPLPEPLQGLTLANADFAQQCRNLFDACLAPEVLRQRVMSMSYGGWDSHDNQYAEISANVADLFGAEGGFATVLPLIRDLPGATAAPADRLLFTFASDFGRQLRANGTAGTDHGSGTYTLLVGAPVRGGVYGELFPAREARPDEDGLVPLETEGADIRGLTSTERIGAAVCDWCDEGAGERVFPGASGAPVEAPGLLDGLLPT